MTMAATPSPESATAADPSWTGPSKAAPAVKESDVTQADIIARDRLLEIHPDQPAVLRRVFSSLLRTIVSGGAQ